MNIETLLQAAQILDECSTSIIKTEQQNEDDIDDNSDLPLRNQTGCFRDREIHNRLEKYRRAHLKDCFDTLKDEVPCQRDRKITNLQVLNLAIKYIQSLKRKDREYENEINCLTYRNIELQQRLRTLKAELNSEGHNVDTWLNSCPEIDRSISTCSASEAEMYRSFDHDDDDNDNHNECNKQIFTTKSILPEIDSKILSNNNQSNRKIPSSSTIKQKSRLSIKKTLNSIPTTNLLQTLTQSENPSYQFLNNISSTLTPINDVRYDIVDMFTKGQQTSTLPSIASLMNRHASPIVSPIKQTIQINTDPLTTSTTNILHQTVATS